MDRLIIERIEGRILLGVTMFVSIMILIGWVAINEPSRMASFEEQHVGRSIERGAELYAQNCTTCHGPNGLGITTRAPALNSPHFFSYNYLADVNDDIGSLQRNIRDWTLQVDELNTERNELITELSGDVTEERANEINMRLYEIRLRLEDDAAALDQEISALQDGSASIISDLGLDADQVEELATLAQTRNLGTRITQAEDDLQPLLAERDNQLAEMQTAFDRNYLPELDQIRAEVESGARDPLDLTNYISTDSSRLSQVGWAGDLRSYVITTLIHGRPGSGDMWNSTGMASFSQQTGAALRDDQIRDLANYILNWDKGDDWTLADLNAVQQFSRLRADAAQVAMAGGEGEETIGTDVEAALAAISDIEGDAAAGEMAYNNNGCAGCHAGGAVGPATMGTWSRTEAERLSLEQFADYSIQQYIVESIIRPNDYIVDGYASGVMPGDYGSQLTPQTIADILAYLESQG